MCYGAPPFRDIASFCPPVHNILDPSTMKIIFDETHYLAFGWGHLWGLMGHHAFTWKIVQTVIRDVVLESQRDAHNLHSSLVINGNKLIATKYLVDLF